MKKLLLMFVAIAAFAATADAQGFLKKLKDKAIERVQDKIENKVERETDDAMDGILDGKKKEQSARPQRETVDDAVGEDSPTTATSSDFKRGSVIMFQDDVTAEQVGEFPSKWDLFQGTKVPGNEDIGLNDMKLILAVTKDRSEYPHEGGDEGDWTAFVLTHGVHSSSEHYYYFNGNKKGDFTYSFKKGWNHVALSFNKRAMKVYFNNKRVVNLPRVNQPTWMCFQVPYEYINLTFIRNVVIAKGAVALYDRNAQDVSAVEKAIAETGKFVTNNILFETGKATLKSESMTEIEKVAAYMKKNPRVRFEVQGHTDNQGSDKVNDPLSQQRAEAVVKALANLGVDDFNLKAVGKGSHEPVADNKTEAGRAKNRRVEFIKK